MDLLKTTITVVSMETKATKNGKTMFKIKGSDNRTYTLWKTKQDGTDSVAYSAFATVENMGVGKAFDISYKEEQIDIDGKSVTMRTIANAFPSNKSVSSNMAQIGMAQDKEAAEDEKWNIINFGKCKFGFLIEAYKLGKDLEKAEEEAEAWANAAMRLSYIGTSQIGETEDKLEQTTLEEIPF